MERYAVFVDAGYLLAAGAQVLNGGVARPRSELRLDCAQVVAVLRDRGYALSDADDLLRVYWYDGALATGLTTEQTTLGFSDNVKLRLGVVNGLGQQKGVDSRIVTDMAELARKHAICDAVLVSGDEDLRIGVEIAQEYGVRVHLLTIEGVNPAPLLRREADSTSEIELAEVQSFLQLVTPLAVVSPSVQRVQNPAVLTCPDNAASTQEYINILDVGARRALAEAIRISNNVPREHDGPLLARTRAAIGRDLSSLEKVELRRELRRQLGV